MMNTLLQEALHHAATSTFEQVVFLLPDAPPRTHQLQAQVRAVASVAFMGDVDGVLEIRLYGDVLPVLACNMLGGAEPPAEPIQLDAFGEVANIICGVLLPQITRASEFRQSAPQVEDGSEYRLRTHAPTATVQLGLEDGRADVLLYLSDSALSSGAAA